MCVKAIAGTTVNEAAGFEAPLLAPGRFARIEDGTSSAGGATQRQLLKVPRLGKLQRPSSVGAAAGQRVPTSKGWRGLRAR